MSLNLSRKVAQLCMRHSPSLRAVARAHDLIRDHQPREAPQTKEEFEAAARRHNLHPDDYKPCAKDHAIGDYPDLPPNSADARDIWYPYDLPELKRNFGEPLHRDFDAYTEDRLDVDTPVPISTNAQIFTFLSVIGGFFLAFWLSKDYMVRPGITAQQFPYSGKKHYTFEPAE